MKPRSILVVSLVVLGCWLVGVIYLSGNAMEARSAADALTPESYLPLIQRQPTPTATPVPEPTPIPYGVHILDNHSSFAHPDSKGGYSVVGQVFNNTDDYLWNVQVTAKFFNSQHVEVNELSYNYLFTIYPRSKICFALDEGADINWSYYEFQPLSYWDDGSAGPAISAHNVLASPVDGRYYVSGSVRNDHNAALDPLWVQATLRDKDKVILDCRSLYDWTGPLYPSQYAAFEIEFSLRKDGYDDVHDYRLDVKADEAHR